MIKKTLALLTISALLALSGCANAKTGLTEPARVAETYINASTALKWDVVDGILCGEALVDARKNRARVTRSEEVIAIKTKSIFITGEIAEVEADVSKKATYGADREAYRFSLQKQGDSWKIYNCQYGEYQHGELKPGPLPAGVDGVVREYIELPAAKKQESSARFLAGRLLKISAAQGQLPQVSEGEVKQAVKNITCLGAADDYAIVQADYYISREEKTYPATAIIDLAAVEGVWRIVRLNISKI
ncbi:MAG: hypothetical protein JL50_21655 [Peptococcaceae bacterium BICA1-7]|nr:MAG: hypothetical protein JL50_21655 [Peptococcaceae bacterium BICA1-7]HBV99344.1 hypothetical protein [Desulfotomaculum sp.]